MKVSILEEGGYDIALLGLSLSYNSEPSEAVAKRLAFKGDGESKFLESIDIKLDITAPRGFWQQCSTYRIGTTTQSQCYDGETEVLTENGWILLKDYNDMSVKVATININSKEFEFQNPTAIVHDKYSGPMVSLKSTKFDLLVTPNHNMLVDTSTRKGKLKFIDASDYNMSLVPKKSIWHGKENEHFILPSFVSKWNTGCRDCVVEWDDKVIPMDDWLAFFGFWLAEGRTAKEKRNYNTYVYQSSKSDHVEKIDALFSRLPFKFHRFDNDGNIRWLISDRQLYEYLHLIGDTYSKFIPNNYKLLSKRQISILVEWAMYGDGTNHKKWSVYLYSSVSKKLADDMQELIIKMGYMANVYKRKERAGETSSIYTVNRSSAIYYKVQNSGKKTVDYDGMIHCLETPNHTLLVRRNGRTTWCGNSTMHTILSRDLTQDDFLLPILDSYLIHLNKLIRERNFEQIKNDLPEGFLQRRIVCTNYMTLQRIIRQRRAHKFSEWQVFCNAVIEQCEYPEFLKEVKLVAESHENDSDLIEQFNRNFDMPKETE